MKWIKDKTRFFKFGLRNKVANDLLIVMIAVFASFGACSKQKFQKVQHSQVASANQFTKPTLDIVLAQDFSDSMLPPLNILRAQMQEFARNLDERWDFRFITIPLQDTVDIRNRPILAQDCSELTSNPCFTPEEASSFNAVNFIPLSSSVMNIDRAFENIETNLTSSSMTASGFLRTGAAFALIIFSNGNDVTNVGFTTTIDGKTVIDPESDTSIVSLNEFKDFLRTFKLSGGIQNAYPIVSYYDQSTACHNASSWAGTRYLQLLETTNVPGAAGAVNGGLPGFSYDICSAGALKNVLPSLRNQLQDLIIAIKFNHAVIDQEPIEESIVVTKTLSSGEKVTVPRSKTNGWFPGFENDGDLSLKTEKPTSFEPAPGNHRTGHFITLNGSFRYSANETIEVTFDPN